VPPGSMSWLVQDVQSRHAQAHRTAEAIHSAHAHLRVPYAATAAIAEICLIFATRPGRCAATSAMWGIRRLQKFLRLGPGPRQGACSSLLGGEACVLSCNLIQLKEAAMKTRTFIAFLLVSALTAGTASAQPVIVENVKIYAAAVVKTPLTAIAADYEKTTGNTPRSFSILPAHGPKVSCGSPSGIADHDCAADSGSRKHGRAPGWNQHPPGSTVAGVAVPPKSAKPMSPARKN